MINGRPAPLLSENHKRLLWHLRSNGQMPRVALSAALGIANGLVTRLIRELQALGMVEEEDPIASSARGRPTIPLRVSGDGGYSVGVTCQPGWIEISLVDFAGKEFLRDSTPFDDPSPKAFARRLEERLAVLAGRLSMHGRRFFGLGIAVPGYICGPDDRRWVVDWLKGWRDVPLETYFSNALGLPVWIENEASAAALAEFYQTGVIGEHTSALVFFLGHGVGGGVIANSDLFTGEHGNAGEIGRLFPSQFHPERPSGIDLLSTMRRAGVAIESLSDVGPHWEQHPSFYEPWLNRVSEQLHDVVNAGAAWLDPGIVIISGALPQALLAELSCRLRGNDPYEFRGHMPQIKASELGSAAVAIGAAMIPIHTMTRVTR